MNKIVLIFLVFLLNSFVLVSCNKSNTINSDRSSIFITNKQSDAELITVKPEPTKVPVQSNSMLDNENHKVFIAEDQSLAVDAVFKLAMSREEVYKKLNNLNYKINLDQKFKDGGIWCEELHLIFDRNNLVKEIFANDVSKYSTVKGLKIGDSKEKMVELYGDKYVTHPEPDITIVEYKFKGNFFNIAINNDNNKISGWGIALESPY